MSSFCWLFIIFRVWLRFNLFSDSKPVTKQDPDGFSLSNFCLVRRRKKSVLTFQILLLLLTEMFPHIIFKLAMKITCGLEGNTKDNSFLNKYQKKWLDTNLSLIFNFFFFNISTFTHLLRFFFRFSQQWFRASRPHQKPPERSLLTPVFLTFVWVGSGWTSTPSAPPRPLRPRSLSAGGGAAKVNESWCEAAAQKEFWRL